MIDLNVVCLHILTKLFLTDFIKRDKGQILNVASLASFEPGPLMATYYSTKSYVYNLTMAIYEELRRKMGIAGDMSSHKFSACNIMPQWIKLFEQLYIKY